MNSLDRSAQIDLQEIIVFLTHITLDASLLTNHRPISNLTFIVKIIENVVYNHLSNFLNSHGLFDNFQITDTALT